jgi:hypothetical protein
MMRRRGSGSSVVSAATSTPLPAGGFFISRRIFFGGRRVSYLQHLQGRKVKGTTPAQDENENDRKTSRNQMDATHGQFHARRRNRVRGDTTTAEIPQTRGRTLHPTRVEWHYAHASVAGGRRCSSPFHFLREWPTLPSAIVLFIRRKDGSCLDRWTSRDRRRNTRRRSGFTAG